MRTLNNQYVVTLHALIRRFANKEQDLKKISRSQCLRGLRRRSAAALLLRLWVRIPREAWMFLCCECCVLSGRGLCDDLITRPEEYYRLWNLLNEEDLVHWGMSHQKQTNGKLNARCYNYSVLMNSEFCFVNHIYIYIFVYIRHCLAVAPWGE
jgi:hypothetical protein